MVNTVNFILGNRCFSECTHCFAQSTATDRTKLSLASAISFIDEINCINGVENIWFNGGEPFLYLQNMKTMISAIHKKNKQMIKISTGAQPFKTLEITRRLISTLPRVDKIYASIDSYHLVKSPIQNYEFLSEVCAEMSISLVLSISYRTLGELAVVLKLIHERQLVYESITKQPVFSSGNAINLTGISEFLSPVIPDDFKCGERSAVTIWPDSSITTCSAYAGRSGNSPRYQSLGEAMTAMSGDEFYQSRCNQTLAEIAKKFGVDGHFDVTSPCGTCRSILSALEAKGLKNVYA